MLTGPDYSTRPSYRHIWDYIDKKWYEPLNAPGQGDVRMTRNERDYKKQVTQRQRNE